MLTSISNSTITHYSAAQKPIKPLFVSLPLEIREEIEKLLDFSSQQALFKVLTTVTHNGEPIESPALKLHLIKERIQAQYQQALIRSDGELKKFALDQLQKLSDSGRFDKVVEKLALFELVCLVSDPGVFKFLQERVQKNTRLKEKLLNWVERSKTEEVQLIAANAMTLLVKAGVQFNNKDLKGIRVPGADLSYGVFDSAQLQGADLRRAKFRTSWLREANLSGAQMAGVQFGEWAYWEKDSWAMCRAYSPDGQTCAMSLGNGMIRVHDTSSWARVHTLTGHTGVVLSVVYSPSGSQIASGSSDKTVRLWDAKSGALGPTLTGHTNAVNSVVYSPSEAQIASGSEDRTVRLWDAESGASVRTLTGLTGRINSVMYSPCGGLLASGSDDRTVRLWDVISGAPVRTWRGHTASVLSVVYSPSGLQIASGSSDNTVRLWDAKSGALMHTLRGHTSYVYSVAYSPCGKQIASASGDQTVRLWNTKSGMSGRTLKGHTGDVWSVVYSPSGGQIASGSRDCTVRLWEAVSGACLWVIREFNGGVTSLAWTLMPEGSYLLTGSDGDNSVRKWEIKKEGEKYKISLCWSTGHEKLTATDALIEGVEGLSEANEQLLKQRGALERKAA